MRWWIGELWSALPERVRALTERRRPAIVLSLDGDLASLIESGSRGQTVQVSDPLPLPNAVELAARMSSDRGEEVELRLPFRSAYSRRIELPNVGQAEIARILSLDLERSTPFVTAQIYSAFVAKPKPGQPEKLDVEQFVVRKAQIDGVFSAMADAGGEIAWIGLWNRERSAALPVDFSVRTAHRPATQWLVPALAASLLVIAGMVLANRYDQALQQVASQVTAQREAAGTVQRSIDKSRKLLDQEASLHRLVDSRVQPLAVLEQLSRVLPDTTYVTEVRIEGEMVEMNGVGKMAAGLPQILEKSGAFTDANLTSPLTIDSRDDRERFSLKARYREQK